jgi:CTP:molybdopterin cytidylyltransferase MocA
VADLVDASGGRVQLVENPAWADGQASSMQTGLDALAASYDAAIFMPVDQPFVPPSLLQQLVRAWQAGAPLAAPAVDSTVRGAPALFDRSLWPALRLVRGDMGGRLVLQANLAQAARIPAAAAWLRDLDTAADLA